MDGHIVSQSGTTLGRRYRIERVIGAGGMGIVYEVTHLHTGQKHALKTLKASADSSSDTVRRFLDETRMTAAIRSEHIVRVTDADSDTETGLPFFVMELLDGENLAALLKRKGSLPAQEVVELLHQAGLALDKTHAREVVHRDLKPENLFLTTRDDGTTCLKILDFGIAKVIDLRTHARSTRNFGTPLYMSPEQYDGDPHIDHRTDLYSLGHIAFTLLVGHPYWEPESQALAKLVQRIMGGASEPATERGRRWNAHLPAEFDGWFAKATARDPFARFDSAGEMVGELANTLGVDLPRSSRPYLAAASGPQKKQRRSRRTIVGITILLVGCGTLASWLLPSAPKSAARAGAEPPASSAPSASGESIELPAIVEPQPPPTASAVEAPSAFAPTPAASAVSKPVTIVPASSGAKKASMGSRTTKASDTF